MLKEHHNMAERKNFLLFAVMIGLAGIVIGGITMWNTVSDLLKP